MQPKKISTLIIARRGKSDIQDVKPEVAMNPSEDDMALHSAAEDLMRAIDDRSISAIAKAFKAGFLICDSEPHVEGPHENVE